VAEITCLFDDMSAFAIDLNADVGESFGAWTIGDDAGVMLHVTSVNIACGFHAGDPGVMRATVTLARSHGVVVGAHPGFPDLAGFGRRELRMAPQDLEDAVAYQIGALSGIAAAQGVRIRHVKPHGALYNMAARDRTMADPIARAIVAVDRSLVLVGRAGSVLLDAGREAGLAVAGEAFADRTYEPDGRLSARSTPGSVLTDPETIAVRAVEMVRRRLVTATDGSALAIEPDTMCVHGDTPGAAGVARRLREALQDAGIQVRPLCELKA
jgi:5-oxoprolinase (ATP-hydrolysing) subunit A